MIEVHSLIFEYPGVRALDDVSFTVRRGDIVALVGPNGAGKTTLLRCIAALEQPISGSIRIGELDALAEPRAAHRKLGYLPDFFGLYRELTVRQCLTYAARAHGLAAEREEAATRRAAERLQIADRLDVKVGTLSRGLSQRVAIAQAIVHEPGVLLLDEPASGLDPEARHSLAQLFLELQAQGMTLIVSSHILSELEEYSSNMLILQNGMIVEHRGLEDSNRQSVPMRLALSAPHDGLLDALAALPGVTEAEVDGRSASFRCSADPARQHELLKTLVQGGVPVCGFTEEKPNLQDAYLAHMRKSGESQPA